MPKMPQEKKFGDSALRLQITGVTEQIMKICDRAKLARDMGVEPSWDLVNPLLQLALRTWGSNLTAVQALGAISSEELDLYLARLKYREEEIPE